jgi:hypothetical protein
VPVSEPRPAVAVVLPFHGDSEEAAFALRQLAGLDTRPGDERVLADNTVDNLAGPLATSGVTVHACSVKRAVYTARNEGAELTSAPWLLFVDADCVLPADLIDRFFDPPPRPEHGAIAGAVAGLPDQPRTVSRYVRSRGHLDQTDLAEHPFGPSAVTANLLVRREAFERIGGFQELTRSGGDLDFSWRIQKAGYELGLNTAARVGHEHRETVSALLKQARRIGAGSRWLGHRHPGYDATFRPAFFGRAVLGAVGWPLLLQPERGAFKALDALWGLACDYGMLDSNRPAGTPSGPARTTVFLREFPLPADPVTAACGDGAFAGALRVEAERRPDHAAWPEVRGKVPTAFWEDDAPRDKARGTAALLRRGRRVSPRFAAAAARLRADGPEAVVLVEPGLEGVARRIADLAGMPAERLESLPEDRTAAARRIAG